MRNFLTDLSSLVTLGVFIIPDISLGTKIIFFILASLGYIMLRYRKTILSWLSLVINKVHRQFLILYRVRIGISLDDQFNQGIVDRANEKLNQLKLEGKIRFINLTSENIPKNDESFEAFLKKDNHLNLNLIVWGVEQQAKDQKIILNFTHFDNARNAFKAIIASEISTLVGQHDFFEIFPDTFEVNLELEEGNITFFSVYLVGLSLMLSRDTQEGLRIFEELILELKPDNPLYLIVLEKLQRCYEILGNEKSFRGNQIAAKAIFEKSYNLNPNHFGTIVGLALATHETGDQLRASQLVEELERRFPNEAITHVDIAYFRILQRNYNDALRHYMVFASMHPDPGIIAQVIDFLSQRIKENPSELGFLFGRGYMEYLTENEIYKTDLRVFLKKASDRDYYRMKSKASRLLTRGR
jgi:tetratricopeptide (TPR) repeat protein